MSKQNVNKGRPAPQQTAASKQAATAGGSRTNVSTGNKTAGKTAGAQTTKPVNAQSRPRTAPVPVKRKSGFRLRPLDIALLVAGVLVVGIIVFSTLQAPSATVDAGAAVSASATHVPVGSPAPDFTVTDPEGASYTLSAQKGKVMVLEFIATWCPHCQADAPMFNQLSEAYKGKGAEVWSINATPYGRDYDPQKNKFPPATTNDLKWFREQFQLTHPILFDQKLNSTQLYGVNSYPSIYIVDKEGKVAFEPPADSLPTYEQLTAKVDELLK
jgi:peroxiredoxin